MRGREDTRKQPELVLIGVRRFGEDVTTPVVITGRRACGTVSDHYARGCMGLTLRLGGAEGLIHLTTEDALRLADVLRAMAVTNLAEVEP